MFPCIVVTIETTLQKKEYSLYILLHFSVKCIPYFTGELCHNVFIQLWNSGWLVDWLVGFPVTSASTWTRVSHCGDWGSTILRNTKQAIVISPPVIFYFLYVDWTSVSMGILWSGA